MRAVIFTGAGGNEVISVGEVPDPVPQRGEVLVRVRAAGLNRADLLQRIGVYPPPPGTRADVPGLEFAGEVLALGPGATRWKAGDRVMAIAAGEAQAERLVAHEAMLLPIPDELSFEQAAALPEAIVTAHDALFTIGGLRPGWTVLIHAIGSGVGLAALQLAKAAGATVIGTSRTEDKLHRARDYGLDHPILVETPPAFADRVKKRTAGRGTPLILDFVGAAYADENLAALATSGCQVVIGTLGGLRAALDLGALLRKRARVVGTALRSRPLDEKIAATRLCEREVLPLIGQGKLRPTLDCVVPFAEAARAYERMEKNESFGKIVLAM